MSEDRSQEERTAMDPRFKMLEHCAFSVRAAEAVMRRYPFMVPTFNDGCMVVLRVEETLLTEWLSSRTLVQLEEEKAFLEREVDPVDVVVWAPFIVPESELVELDHPKNGRRRSRRV